MNEYYCYLIIPTANQNYSYIGITNDLNKRIKQHNKIIKGGAKCTRRYDDWKYNNYVKCCSKSNALKLEYKLKKIKGAYNRIFAFSQIKN
jgi:predicted GIY-YIG superfamily endonuclease